MRLKGSGILMVIMILTAGRAMATRRCIAAIDRGNAASCAQTPDNISGDWKASFEVEDIKTPVTFSLKLDGQRVTGTANSDHTGPGTLKDGRWVNGELSFTMDFTAHESVVVTGRFKDGKLVGEFATEGRRGTWEASKGAPK
jgi:hypothetical protein